MIHLNHARYTFPSGGCIGPVDLHVRAGEFVVLAGATGSGKSTVVRMAVGLTQRHGHGLVEGEIRLCGRDPAGLSGAERVRAAGFVGQEVDDCVLAGTCAAEISFGLESAGLDACMVAAALARVGLAGFEGRDPLELSGGERQRLVIGAALAANPRVLVLDEPLSQLDPPGAREIVTLLRQVADEGVAVLLVEHRLGLLGAANRVVYLGEALNPGGHRGPPLRGGLAGDVEGRPGRRGLAGGWEVAGEGSAGEVVSLLYACNLTFHHIGHRGVQGLALAVHPGERIALVGGNGAGKSTLLGLLAGRLAPDAGKVVRTGRVLEVPQNADLVLFSETTLGELDYAASEARRAPEGVALLAAFGLDGLGHRAPQALSRGQRLRVAVASMAAAKPAVLLLDEAGSGQDHENLLRLFTAIRAEAQTVVFSSHDPGLVAQFATRVIWLDKGRIIEDLPIERSTWCGEPRHQDDPEVSPPLRDHHDPEVSPPIREDGGLDPRLRLCLVVALGLAVILLEGVVPLVLLASALVLAACVHPKARPWRRGLLIAAALVAWSTAFSQSLFWADWPRTPLFTLGPVTFWREGALHGLAQSTRFISLTASGLLLAVSTPTDRLVTALRSPFLGERLPYPLVVMVAAMVRFVPLVATEWAQVRAARRARGRPVWQRTPLAWLFLEVALLRPVVARCIRRARMLSESLDTRGFDTSAPRGIAIPLRWSSRDSVGLALASATLLSLGVARGLYGLYTSDVWYHSGLRPLYAFVRGWL